MLPDLKQLRKRLADANDYAYPECIAEAIDTLCYFRRRDKEAPVYADEGWMMY
ncbi:hypothetical protein C7405_10638 [Paraburkholderia caballeronis]|nr:hypothetical protein C7405_10638 [Paraburkholderia caballeronis]